MIFDKNSILSTMNPVSIIFGFAFILIISIYSAYKYRNTYDLKKSLKYSMLLFLIIGFILIIINVPILIIIGYGICTLIFTIWFSNYYFYKK